MSRATNVTRFNPTFRGAFRVSRASSGASTPAQTQNHRREVHARSLQVSLRAHRVAPRRFERRPRRHPARSDLGFARGVDARSNKSRGSEARRSAAGARGNSAEATRASSIRARSAIDAMQVRA